MKIEIRDDIAFVFTPYNPLFVRKIKSIGGAKWDFDKRCWKIPASTVDAAREIMVDVYGESDLPDDVEKVTVRVTFPDGIAECRSPVVVFGRVIASAYGRDSGAKVGDGVVFVKGKPDSGGSAKNWTTVIHDGSIVEIRNVPVTALNDSYDYEIVKEKKIDRAALEAEKVKLLKRIAEIEKLLAEN